METGTGAGTEMRAVAEAETRAGTGMGARVERGKRTRMEREGGIE